MNLSFREMERALLRLVDRGFEPEVELYINGMSNCM